MTAKDWFGVVVRGTGLQCFIWGLPYFNGIRNPDIEHGLQAMDYVVSMFLYWVPGVVFLCLADSVVKLAYSDPKID